MDGTAADVFSRSVRLVAPLVMAGAGGYAHADVHEDDDDHFHGHSHGVGLPGDGDEGSLRTAKAVVMVLIALLTFAASAAPWAIARLERATMLMALSCMLSVGAILGAALCHMLPHASEQYADYLHTVGKDSHFPYAGVAAGCVFLFLVCVDSMFVAHWAHRTQRAARGHPHFSSAPPLTPTERDTAASTTRPDDRVNGEETADGEVCGNSAKVYVDSNDGDNSEGEDGLIQEQRGGVRQIVRAWVFFVALSVHALFDGLSIGAEQSMAGYWSMAGAVISHKAMDGFVLGVTVYYANFRQWLAVSALVFCALVTPLGVGVGWAATSLATGAEGVLVAAVIVSMSAGSFLFIAIVEMLPFGLQGHRRWVAPKMALCMAGFAVMAVLALWV